MTVRAVVRRKKESNGESENDTRTRKNREINEDKISNYGQMHFHVTHHVWQELWPPDPWYFPDAQLVQEEALPAEYLPLAQSVQLTAAPVAYWPDVQLSQLSAPAEPWNWPPGQAVQPSDCSK